MEVVIFKQYGGAVSQMTVTQEMYDNGWTTAQVATRDVPGTLNVPQVAAEHQDLIRVYDIPDANNQFVLRYNFDTGLWEQVLDENDLPIAVVGNIQYDHNFLVLDDSTLPTVRFFAAWEIDSALLVTGTGTQSHPAFYEDAQ